nr:hypothetical protein [Tanacetum cinerariifolium]
MKHVLTNAKFKEFREELTGKMYCGVGSSKSKDGHIEYVVLEDTCTNGETMKKHYKKEKKRNKNDFFLPIDINHSYANFPLHYDRFIPSNAFQQVSPVHGFVHDNRTGEKVAMLMGKWDEAMYYVLGDPTTKPKGYDPMTEAVLLWERDKSATKTRYNLTPFAISLNEITPGLRERLPPTDSRLRPDQRHLENGEYELANAEKLRLEQLQRQ